jgi:hypothetical protein
MDSRVFASNYYQTTNNKENSNVPTATERLIDAGFRFSSNNLDKLFHALRLIFDEPTVYITWAIDDDGFHIAMDYDNGAAFLPDAHWFHKDRPRDHLPAVTGEIRKWLGDLSHADKRRICKSMPMEEAYVADPAIDLTGYRVALRRTRDGAHSMVTVTPDWV